jgi:excisionase family DNA binding protein
MPAVDRSRGGPGDAGRLARVPTPARFLQLADVAEVLNISAAQVYALVRSGDLPAIKIGGRGQWRVEASELESYIARMYEETRDFVSRHPLGRSDDDGEPEGDREGGGPADVDPAADGGDGPRTGHRHQTVPEVPKDGGS